MWEEKFATPEFVYGKAPTQFLVDHRQHLTPGASALSVADGEGRNGVYMAEQGMDVTTYEFSPSALAKARNLAAERAVTVKARQFDVLAQDFDGAYDLVAGIFIQFVGPVERARLFAQMQKVTKPGGLVLLHGFTPEQIQLGTGGPPFVANMYTCKTLRESFPGWEVVECREYERDQMSGQGHVGTAALIDFVARKPAQPSG